MSISLIMDNKFLKINDDLQELLNSVNGCQYTDLDEDSPLDVAFMSERSNFNCLHVNIRSLIANLDPLTFLLNDLRERGIVIHTFAICETYLNDQNVQLAKLENYVPIHVCRKKRLGGGVSFCT